MIGIIMGMVMKHGWLENLVELAMEVWFAGKIIPTNCGTIFQQTMFDCRRGHHLRMGPSNMTLMQGPNTPTLSKFEGAPVSPWRCTPCGANVMALEGDNTCAISLEFRWTVAYCCNVFTSVYLRAMGNFLPANS